MALGTVFGKVNAHIEFLHTGTNGVLLAQAFRFLAMDAVSTKRFNTAAEEMQSGGFADVHRNNHLSTWRSKAGVSYGRASAIFRGCSLRDDARDRKRDPDGARDRAVLGAGCSTGVPLTH
jgi:hypothetical protein